jgi:hypothetical protein
MKCQICNQDLLFDGNTCSKCAGELINDLRKERDALRGALEKIVNGRFHIGNDENGNMFGPPDSVMCRNIAKKALGIQD